MVCVVKKTKQGYVVGVCGKEEGMQIVRVKWCDRRRWSDTAAERERARKRQTERWREREEIESRRESVYLLCVYIGIHISIHKHTHTHAHTQAQAHAHTHTQINLCMYIHMYTHTTHKYVWYVETSQFFFIYIEVLSALQRDDSEIPKVYEGVLHV